MIAATGSSMTARHQEHLWRDHRDRLFRFVLRRVGDEATAEDIVHDVLVRAHEHRPGLRDGGKLEPWLYQITRNAVIDHYRARKPSVPLPDTLASAEDADPTVRSELAECLRPLVEQLPDTYREAIELSELQGLTQRETAARLGLSLSGAKSRVQRARRLLEGMLTDCCRLEFDRRGGIVDYQARAAARGRCGPGCGSAT
jgi:RNA polymerase sigma-70 factor, ECF subfamily